ncbi:MAG TPA: hypothetical protein VGH30_03190 [Jatrophihabitantaceae bacterium]
MAIPVLWLIGPSGVGKSSVGWAVYTRLYRTGDLTGYVDLDQVGLCYPQPQDDPNNHRVKAAGLAAMLQVYRGFGATRLVVCGGAEHADLAPLYLERLPDTDSVIVRLRADSATLRERIFARGRGHGPALPGGFVGLPDETLEEMAREAADEADALDRCDFAHACIDTDGRTVAELADEVLTLFP